MTNPKIKRMFEKLNEEIEAQGECKGIIVRAYITEYYKEYPPPANRSSIHSNIRLNIARLKSCPGCEHCWGIYEELPNISADCPVELPARIVNKEFYRLEVEVDSIDLETGIPDGWHLVAKEIPVKPNEEKTR